MVDGMKLVLLGGTVETARRVSSSAWYVLVLKFFFLYSLSHKLSSSLGPILSTVRPVPSPSFFSLSFSAVLFV
jgi:hypothetical protein